MAGLFQASWAGALVAGRDVWCFPHAGWVGRVGTVSFTRLEGVKLEGRTCRAKGTWDGLEEQGPSIPRCPV